MRIGVACAKALAWALGCGLVGVDTLDVIAQNAGERAGRVCPALDARRHFVYAGVYGRAEDGLWRPETGLLVGRPEQVAERVPEGTFVFGDGVRAYADVFTGERYEIGPEELMIGQARHVARLAVEAFRAGRRDDPLELVPRYHRRTEAEEKLAGRNSQC
jgi:tRNA threonylcarbamoyladenosine biosynthesis protein TsaB